jgi:predicted hydrocarbon binding protein
MTSMAASTYHYPNKMGRIIFQAMEEILGRNGMNAVLNLASLAHFIGNYPPDNLERQFGFSDLSKIQTSLEELFGPLGGRGVSLRSGRACFKYGLREFGPMLGVTDLAFRLLPHDEKLKNGTLLFAEVFNRFSDQRVRVEENKEHIYWHIERCPVCWGRHTGQPVCHLAVGILQESLYWVSGGKYYQVQETHCIAKGDPACTIVVDKQPVE